MSTLVGLQRRSTTKIYDLLCALYHMLVLHLVLHVITVLNFAKL